MGLEDVLITEELERRPSRAPDYALESRTLAALAHEMAAHPRNVLTKLAELAMEVCGAGSAGVSILESDGQRDIFRWHAIAGRLARHAGGSIPRNDSPCGVVVKQNCALLFRQPERRYSYCAGVGEPMEETLLVPWMSNGRPVGTVWVIAHTPDKQFVAEDVRLLESLSLFAAAAFQMAGTREAAELDVMTRLHQLNQRLLMVPDLERALYEVLDAVIALLDADMGNIQLYATGTGQLEVVAQRGTCAAGADVQATPMRTRGGEVLGILSAHFQGQHRPSAHQLRILDLYTQQASDLIHRMRIEHALRESEGLFRSLADASPALIWQVDASGSTVYLNQRYLDMSGQPLHQLLGTGWQDLLHPDDRSAYLAAGAQALQSHGRFLQRARFRLKGGQWHWFESHALPWYGNHGEYRGHVGLSIDVNEAVQAEDALKLADRRKDQFLATLAHELRNPLAPISNAIHLLRYPDGQRASDRLIPIIDRQVRQMVRLVDDLMDVSRITRGKIALEMQPVDLADVLAGAVETSQPMIAQGEHALHLDLGPEPLVLCADRVRLTQVFANLLNNAAKYTEPGGTISLLARRAGDWAEVLVRDDGIGIPPPHLGDVFEMFTQVGEAAGRSQGGLGIGLTMVRDLVALHGGQVEAFSEGVQCGSEFRVRLPMHAAGEACALPQPVPPGGEARGDRLAGRRILIADDNQDAAESLSLLLQADGALTSAVYDGRDVLPAMERDLPHDVILDIGMPGMDGYQVAQRIRSDARFAGVRLIALTGWGQGADRLRSQAVGFDHHLTKPVDIDTLEALLLQRSAH